MKILKTEKPEIKLVGLKTRTLNQNEFNPETAKIAPLVGRYWNENTAEQIPNRKNPGVVLVGYSNYASDEHGEYDFLFGEEVTRFDGVPATLSQLTVPAASYLEITSDLGPMPQIMFQTWQKVWELTQQKKLGAERSYQVDFEIHDQQNSDPNQQVFKIYLGIK